MWLNRVTLTLASSQLLRKYSARAVPSPKSDIWESVVGLEVHAQIQANTKLFSPTEVNFGAPVNTLVSFLDASVPGTLPVLNRKCVEAAVATAAALSCQINMTSMFDRKHYFYADLPAGYQITQQRKAIAENGHLKFLVMVQDGKTKPHYKTCRIKQLQLEQDSGKSLHDDDANRSLIDLNRAGIALMEIVFEPDLSTGEEAAALVKELCLILQTLEACSCKMEEGALRVDANISVNRKGEGLGVRTEVKNLSSLRSLVGAIEYEIRRQTEVLEGNGVVINETRSFDAERKITLPMRDKEVQQDYRFMPEPNLPPLKLYNDPNSDSRADANRINIANILNKPIQLPDVIRQNLMNKFNLRIETAHTILNIPGLLKYYEKVMSFVPVTHGVRTANVLLTEVKEQLDDRDLSFETISLEPATIGDLVKLVESREIHVSTAKDVLVLLFGGDQRSPSQIVEEEGWRTVSDDAIIEDVCRRVISSNPKLVEGYRTKNKSKYFKKLTGIAKKESEGNIDMKKAVETLQRFLDEK